MNKYIIEGNILVYSQNNFDLIHEVRNILKINTKYSVYDESLKYYHNMFYSKYYEFVFTKTVNNNLIVQLINKLKDCKQNVISPKKYIIFHNFHYINEKYYKNFQSIFECLSDSVKFIFTSNKQILFLTSFFLTKNVTNDTNKYIYNFQSSLKKDCKNIIDHIYQPYRTIDFQNIRTKLYNLLFSYQDICIILQSLCNVAVEKKTKQRNSIVHFASMVDSMAKKGNKDIIYLEHFILLLINNDNIF